MHRHQRSTTQRTDVIQITARGHAYRFVCARGDEPALMHAVRAMADDHAEPLDWFDAALVAYELARRAAAPTPCTALTTTPPGTQRPDHDPTRHPFKSEH